MIHCMYYSLLRQIHQMRRWLTLLCVDDIWGSHQPSMWTWTTNETRYLFFNIVQDFLVSTPFLLTSSWILATGSSKRCHDNEDGKCEKKKREIETEASLGYEKTHILWPPRYRDHKKSSLFDPFRSRLFFHHGLISWHPPGAIWSTNFPQLKTWICRYNEALGKRVESKRRSNNWESPVSCKQMSSLAIWYELKGCSRCTRWRHASWVL